MTIHVRHPAPQEQFLVDGCPRCAEYARDLGLHFGEQRFREFWAKMLQVEYHDNGNWASELDKELGRNLYFVSLALQRAFGLDPHQIASPPRFTVIIPPEVTT